MRKTKTVQIDWGKPCADPENPKPGENRDHGKKFLITEMGAEPAEYWAMRLALAMTKSGIDVPEGATNWGAILAYGIMKGIGSLPWNEARPLLDEMWSCIQIVEPLITRPPTEDDIEEVQTRLVLRQEVFELHAGFSVAEILSLLALEVLRRQEISQNTPTSHPLSESLSQADLPH
jgi:hypothetical protein